MHNMYVQIPITEILNGIDPTVAVTILKKSPCMKHIKA